MSALTTMIEATDSSRRLRRSLRPQKTLLLWLAGVRVVLGVVALPLAPVLYRDHFVLLVLLRPTKEVLLASGFLVKQGDVALVPVLAAAVPLVVLGVWHFYALGVAYAKDVHDVRLGGIAGRLLPPERIKKLTKALDRAGPRVVLLGRLAIFPSALLAAAAGTTKMEPRRFLAADGAGALLSIVEAIGAGFLLGEAYDEAGPWITAAGGIALVVVLYLVGRRLRAG